MPTRVAIVSDTHVPARASAIPDWVEEEIRAADRVVHAGDFDSQATLDHVCDLAADLTAVFGNMDPGGLDLPRVATLDVEDVEFVVTHGHSHGRGRPGFEDRVARTIREYGRAGSVGVFGHIHEVRDERVDGVRLLNPGSATAASPATEATMLRATVDGDDLSASVLRE